MIGISRVSTKMTSLLGLVAGMAIWVAGSAALSAGTTREQSVAAPKGDVASKDPAAAASGSLAERQQQVASRYKRFEEVLLRMAELSASDDPQRAALLRQVAARSKKYLIGVKFERIVDLLDKDRLSVAVTNQNDLSKDLQGLLELLLSEDRAKRLETEQERVRGYLKQINKLIKEQQGVQAQTRRTEGTEEELGRRQAKLTEQTGKLGEQVKRDTEAQQKEQAENEQQEQDQNDDQKGEDESAKPGQDGEQKPSSGDAESKSKNEGEPAESSPSEEGEATDSPPSESSPSKSKPPQGQPGSDPSQPGQPGGPSDEGEKPEEPQEPQATQPTDPVQKRLQAAQQRMQEAEERLKQAQREDAVDRQRKALEELEQAKAELEKILRQLREEELARVIAFLEGRFRKMLEEQKQVYDATVRLVGIAESERGRNGEIEAGRLSRKESQIAMEADKALVLLREEGTAVAMPEAVREIRDDMSQVATRLNELKVDTITQGIEEDIIAGLEDMLAALEKAKQNLEEKKQNPMPSPPGEPQEPPLVDSLAELKMIRALQMRVNRRTDTYSKLIEGEQALQPELLEALGELAERQERIFRTTRDIAVGRNQ